MYRQYFDEISGTFFVGDDATIDRNLTMLRNKAIKPNGSFTLTEYCYALDIDNIDPFNDIVLKRGSINYPYVFDQYLGERSGICTMCVTILPP